MNRKYKTKGTVEEIQIPVKSLRVGGEKDGND